MGGNTTFWHVTRMFSALDCLVDEGIAAKVLDAAKFGGIDPRFAELVVEQTLVIDRRRLPARRGHLAKGHSAHGPPGTNSTRTRSLIGVRP